MPPKKKLALSASDEVEPTEEVVEKTRPGEDRSTQTVPVTHQHVTFVPDELQELHARSGRLDDGSVQQELRVEAVRRPQEEVRVEFVKRRGQDFPVKRCAPFLEIFNCSKSTSGFCINHS